MAGDVVEVPGAGDDVFVALHELLDHRVIGHVDHVRHRRQQVDNVVQPFALQQRSQLGDDVGNTFQRSPIVQLRRLARQIRE